MLLNVFKKIIPFFQRYAVRPGICAARYPVILLHGLGYRDDMIISSWGHVPDYLRRGGAQVFLGNLEAYDSMVKDLKNRGL